MDSRFRLAIKEQPVESINREYNIYIFLVRSTSLRTNLLFYFFFLLFLLIFSTIFNRSLFFREKYHYI